MSGPTRKARGCPSAWKETIPQGILISRSCQCLTRDQAGKYGAKTLTVIVATHRFISSFSREEILVIAEHSTCRSPHEPSQSGVLGRASEMPANSASAFYVRMAFHRMLQTRVARSAGRSLAAGRAKIISAARDPRQAIP